MKFEDIKIERMGKEYWAGFKDGKYKYIYKDGTAHSACREGEPKAGWFNSHEEAEKAVRLFIKKEHTPVPTKPTRGIVATWLYNSKNKE